MGIRYKVYVDAGHAGVAGFPVTAGKRTPFIPELGRQILEHEFNRAVADKLIALLVKHGIEFMDVSPNPRVDMPLGQRVDRINSDYRTFMAQNSRNKAIVISIHFNAHKTEFHLSNASGVETYHFTGSVEGLKLAQAIHSETIKGTPQVDRGVKHSNFTIIAKTLPPASLWEGGFLDSDEHRLMLNSGFTSESAQQILDGICKYWGLDCAKECTCDEPCQDCEMYKAQIEELQLKLQLADAKIAQAIYQLTK
jgi:N-acetylmuramoyl-L-alanine amidase